MTQTRFFGILTVLTLLAAIFFNPAPASATHTSQITSTITGTGQFTEPWNHGTCGTFSITFDPAGGPVTASWQAFCPRTDEKTGAKIGEETIQATLTGTFDGGDGGVVRGTIASGEVSVTYSVTTCDNCIDGTQSLVGGTWEGTLRADGTGNGWIMRQDAVWNVTYSAADFQAGLGASSPTTAPIPTATSFAVIGQSVELSWQARDLIASSPTLSQAQQAILNQDSVIIARDANNNFYAISNQGQTISLPQELSSVYQVSNNFGILGNDNVLASSELGSLLGQINGGGDFGLLDKIPGYLKDRDYVVLTTTCSPAAQCHTEMKVNSTASSMIVLRDAIGNGSDKTCKDKSTSSGMYEISFFRSSEHTSIRGTINGGG